MHISPKPYAAAPRAANVHAGGLNVNMVEDYHSTEAVLRSKCSLHCSSLGSSVVVHFAVNTSNLCSYAFVTRISVSEA